MAQERYGLSLNKVKDTNQSLNNDRIVATTTQLRKRLFDSAIAPAVSDDERKGFEVGAIWVDTATDKVYVNADNTAGAAVWKDVSTTPPGYTVVSSTSDPTVNDDSGDGYAVGQLWVNTSSGKAFILKDASVGTAVWETFLLKEIAETNTGAKTFSGASNIIIPTTAPNTNGAIGLSSSIFQAHDGTSAKSYLRTDTAVTDTYGTNIGIGTTNDGAYVDVDATNAAITFTVNVTGKYLIGFVFDYSATNDTVGTLQSTTWFRLTDGTNPTLGIAAGYSGSSTGTEFVDTVTFPVTLVHLFTFSSTGSKTVKLQKRNVASSSLTSRSVILADGMSMWSIRAAD